MAQDYHIDLSGCLFHRKTTGVACVGVNDGKHNGCAVKLKLKKRIQKSLFIGTQKEEYAKLYSILIYLLIKDKLGEIKRLVICDDEDFFYVKKYLEFLLPPTHTFNIIDISELRKLLGNKKKSKADNKANVYRKHAHKGIKIKQKLNLDVVEIKYNIIEEYWNVIK